MTAGSYNVKLTKLLNNIKPKHYCNNNLKLFQEQKNNNFNNKLFNKLRCRVILWPYLCVKINASSVSTAICETILP